MLQDHAIRPQQNGRAKRRPGEFQSVRIKQLQSQSRAPGEDGARRGFDPKSSQALGGLVLRHMGGLRSRDGS